MELMAYSTVQELPSPISMRDLFVTQLMMKNFSIALSNTLLKKLKRLKSNQERI
jgi:hypothetical protein